jgi:hypothetical protein
MAKYSFAFLFLFAVCGLQAQQYAIDSAITSDDTGYAKHLYFAKRAEELAIFNGVYHHGYPPSIEGHAYFQSPEWQKGYVIYDNILYENMAMKYDLLKDQLIVTPKEQSGMLITLFSPRVEQFSFSTFTFIRIDKTDQNSYLSPGFYQQLVRGKLTALAKRTKIINEKIEGTALLQKFEETVKYYLLKGGIFYPVKHKKDILTIVKDRRKEVQRFLLKNKLNYRKDREKTLVAVVEFYNQSSY